MARRRIGQYEIVRRLGAGASGVAYLGRDTRLLRPVVLKLLRAPRSAGARRALLGEARLASAIEHPNVCAVYEVGTSGGEAFIAMQHVPGRDLAALLKDGALALPLLLSVAMQAADGLDAAHRLQIVHRDLKPENVMLSDGGLVKILDFGLARRLGPRAAAAATGRPWALRRSSRRRGGTVAYMAPELFVTGEADERSDVFSLGVLLYEMATGRHPFRHPGASATQVARAIQFREPESPSLARPDLPLELEAVVLRALAKTPSQRIASAAELREALRTVARSRGSEPGLLPGEAAVPVPGSERGAGLLSMLAERFLGKADVPATTLAVLPFRDLASEPLAPLYGLALADALAARLSRLPGVAVRPAGSLLARPDALLDPLRAGRELLASHVVAGAFLREGASFTLSWQLLEIASGVMRSGGTFSVASLDLVAVQDQIGQDVFATLRGDGGALAPRPPAGASLEGALSEQYLEGRALLSQFLLRSSAREDLHRAQDRFTAVLERSPGFAPAHAALGLSHLHYVRGGLGGLIQLMAAQQCLDAALALDPGLTEADLYRVLTLLARGEKEAARRAIQRLLEMAGNDFDVRLVAGTILRLDGLFEPALRELGTALALNPAAAVLVYDQRARLHQYAGRLELAEQELRKGLLLEPRHPLLRTSLGYLQLRRGDASGAVATLEQVLADARDLRIVHPTLALAYHAAGETQKARELVTEDVLVAADADGEMAYRLATQFAFAGNAFEALHWLRKAIYRGNENWPWFTTNPLWGKLAGNADLKRVLQDLERTWRENKRRWQAFLARRRP